MDALLRKIDEYLSDEGKAILARKTRDGLGGGVVKTLRAFLFDYSGGLCVVCEQPCTNDTGSESSAEVGHIIPASWYGNSDNRSGYAPGNVATMCRACNSSAKDFPFHRHIHAIRWDLIPTEWPPMYRKSGGGKKQHADDAFKIRKAKGLPF